MGIVYVVFVPSEGYLTDFDPYDGRIKYSENLVEAMIFERLQTALIVQKFLCWVHYKGERLVTIAPFPHNQPIGG